MKTNHQQRIGQKAVKYLSALVPIEKDLHIVLSAESQNDYGIDFHMQTFLEEEHQGYFYHLQVKGTNSRPKMGNDKLISFKLESGEYKNFLSKFQNPVAIIIVFLGQTKADTKAFFHHIQNNEAEKLKVTIKIDPRNLLDTSKESWMQLLDGLSKSKVILAKKVQINELSTNSLTDNIQVIDEFENHAYSLPGHKYNFDLNPDKNRLISSLFFPDGRRLNHVADNNWTEEHAIKFTVQTTLEVKDKINQVREGKVDEISFIGKYREYTQTKIISEGEGEFKFGVPREEVKITFKNQEGRKLTRTACIFYSKSEQLIKITSSEYEQGNFNFKISFSPNEGTANFSLNFNDSVENYLEAYDKCIVFLDNSKIYLEQDNLEREILDTEKLDDSFAFIKGLSKIQKISGIIFPFPFKYELTEEDFNNLNLIHTWLILKPYSFSFKLTSEESLNYVDSLFITELTRNICVQNRTFILKIQGNGLMTKKEIENGATIVVHFENNHHTLSEIE